MNKKWLKWMAVTCATALLLTLPGLSVLADELQEDEIIVSMAEEPIQEPDETEQADHASILAGEESSEIVLAEDETVLEKNESTDELVGVESTGNATLDNFINDYRFTAGVYWPDGQTPKIASYQGWGCCAYCADYVKYCFGINNPRGGTYFTNINEVRQGDVLVVGNPSDGTGHWFVCLKRSGNSLYVAEGNFSSYVRIGWNYTISGSKFAEDGRYFNCGYHFQLNSAPGAASLVCTPGTSVTPTLLVWSNPTGATKYTLRIYKGECWTGENVHNEWDLKRTSSQVQLSAGYYEAYVDACNDYGYTMSNVVKFNVQKASISNATITNIVDKTYTGSPQTQAPNVKIGNTTLTQNTHYTLSYSNNTNVGTATVTITGKGDCTGSVSKTFAIKRAAPKLSFKNSSVTKSLTDAAFTNALTKTTDGTVTFKSSNTNVATVNSSSGLVTITGAGTTTITATAAAGKNYSAGSASYTLTVKEASTVTSGFSDVQDPTHPYYDAIYWAADAGITGGYKDGTFGINNPCTRGHAVMFLWKMAGAPAPQTVAKTPFPDVPKSHPYFKAVLWAQQNGITKGYTSGANKGMFGIDDTCTRGQIMTFIWNFKDKPAPKPVSKSPFSDVPTSHPYYKAILWGSQNGVTKGYTTGPNAGKFGINDNCTRGQIVKFLYNIR